MENEIHSYPSLCWESLQEYTLLEVGLKRHASLGPKAETPKIAQERKALSRLKVTPLRKLFPSLMNHTLIECAMARVNNGVVVLEALGGLHIWSSLPCDSHISSLSLQYQ
jgi:hypothetical protein